MKAYIEIHPFVEGSSTRTSPMRVFFEAHVYFDDPTTRALEPEYTTAQVSSIQGAVTLARNWLKSFGLTLSEETVLYRDNVFTVDATRVLKREDVLDTFAGWGLDLEDLSGTIVQFVQSGGEILCTLINHKGETEKIQVVDE